MRFVILFLFSMEVMAQGVGGGGSGGGGLSRPMARNPGCVEGTKSIFHEVDPTDRDRTISVVRTCRNGTYYDLSDYIYNPKARCHEGRRRTWQTTSESGDQRMVCRNGKWVPVHP